MDSSPSPWIAAGYEGALNTGRSICGQLYGATAFLGYLSGKNEKHAPGVEDEARKNAIKLVKNLFQGFIDRFEDTDCQTLTGCDWSKKADQVRFMEEKIYERTCLPQLEYVFSECLAAISLHTKG
jgi:hypothetical protein